LQDRILEIVARTNSVLYLGGGTALSRFYLHHRYSDDLDFFSPPVSSWVEMVQDMVERIEKQRFIVESGPLDLNFARISVRSPEDDEKINVKVDFIQSDHPRFGSLKETVEFPRVDHIRNILSNKLVYIASMEPKNFADIWMICRFLPFHWREVIEEARQKALIDEFTISRCLHEFSSSELSRVRWIQPPDPRDFERERDVIVENIITGGENTLAKG